MSKTPEELAEDHAFNIFAERYESLISEDRHVYDEAVNAFLAGYQAGRLNSEAVQAAKDQVADTDKVMNSSNNSNGWISVKDRMPDIGDLVLLHASCSDQKTPFVSLGFLDNHPDHWIEEKQWNVWERVQYDHLMLDIGKGVTYWMPLPKPPEE